MPSGVVFAKRSSLNQEYVKQLQEESQTITKQECDKNKKKNEKMQPKGRGWKCIDSCCWFIGCMCTTWWLLLFLYHCLPAHLSGFKSPESPGVRLKNEGLTPLHPVVLVPGIVTGGLELWEGRPCSHGLFRKRLWGGSFAQILQMFFFLIL